jgi:D-3-phosphoglycerate dehydrogenase / 2-oxoglutarate reductase
VKIVITDHRFASIDQERRLVEGQGWELVVGQATEGPELLALCRDADAIITARAKLTAEVIAAASRCRVIVRYGIGIDTVDLEAATAHGIMVANVPDYCVDEVSDHALALMLMVARGMPQGVALAREDQWVMSKMPKLYRLKGKTCGLFGMGQIGGLLAAKVAALGMRVAVCDPYLTADRARAAGVRQVDFATLLAGSDVISLHAPLNAETHYLFDEQAFARMKPTAVIVNTARGGLIDEAALLRALDAGQIAGAGLDVVESEAQVTPIRRALVEHPKVIVTAHTAWLSEEARSELQRKAAEEAVAVLNGRKPYGLVNRLVEARV